MRPSNIKGSFIEPMLCFSTSSLPECRGSTQGERKFLDFHRTSVLLRASR